MRTEPREESDAVTTADGAVRQLEKAERLHRHPEADELQDDEDTSDVISLGKGSGAPEEDAAGDADLLGGVPRERDKRKPYEI